ncbi:unnamed protein product [Rotaria sordida]|uniref:Uncharacterized protein n=1 Tax=Rotaria sordida TaxID=392033 RepID=A0A813X7I4_9BILA|nr:unnamed protein product [Rotaria sordida]CAF0860907.1 unnamed protein product [Rotaria sordida]
MDLLYRSAKQRHRDNARILTNIAQRKRNRELAKQTMASSFNTTSSTTTPPSTTSLTSTTNSLILKGIENFSGAPDLRDHFNAARLSFEDARALISQYLIGNKYVAFIHLFLLFYCTKLLSTTILTVKNGCY